MDPNHPDKNKLKIKLKFPSKKPTTTPPPPDDEVLDKGKSRAEAEAEPEEVVNTNKKVCPHCSKEFSNGKALGGHLRIHAIEKDYKPKKQKFVVGSSSGTQEFWCNICDRRYRSEKALYGHMRSHPDRGYRGMEPPNGFPTEDEDEDEDEEDEDEDEDEEGGVRELRWRVTGKRGQKIMDSTMTESSSFEAAATELMLFMANSVGVEDEDEDEDENNEGDFMKKVKRLVREKLGKKKMEDEEEKKSGIKKEKLEEIEGILKEQGLKIEEFDEDELYFLQDDLGISTVFADDCYYNSDSSSNNEIVVVSTKSDKKKKKKDKDKKKRKRVSGFEPGFERPNKKPHKKDDGDDDGDGGDNDNVDSPQQPATQLDWPCYTCGKIFNSHQALGGHRSSHNKKNYSKSLLALTLAQDPIQGGQVQIDQGSGLTDVGPWSRSGSGDEEVKSVVEVGESSLSSPPAPAQAQTQTSSPSGPSFESSPSAQTSSGQRDPLPYMIDLNVSLMDEEEEEGGDGVIDSGF